MNKCNYNIILIGMPGSGKSTIGRVLAEKLKRVFIDSDAYIEEKKGCSISELFTFGEEFFRNIETITLRELLQIQGIVLATGGGVVKQQENINLLRKSGLVIFINRDVENIIKDIDISCRPLISNDIKKIYTLYDERNDLYEKCCHIDINNNSSIEECIKNIITRIEIY